MMDTELQSLLSEKDGKHGRENAAVVLSPDITRNAARLRKLRRDRRQAILCAFAGAVFLLLAAGVALLLKTAPDPESILRPILLAAGGGMALILLLSPFLAWYSDEDRKNSEA